MRKKIILFSVMAAEFLAMILLLVQNVTLRNKLNEKAEPVMYVDNSDKIYKDTNTDNFITQETVTVTEPVKSTEETTVQTEPENKSEPEKILVYDNGIEQVEYPVIEGAPLNNYDFSTLTTDEKKKKMYYENGERAAAFGIDVSQYQGTINWEKVKAEGVEFSIMRLGYRGYETGAMNTDSKFLEYVQGAKAAGIGIGVYFYSQAVNAEEAKEEAAYVIKTLRENNITPEYPVIFDWEFVTDEDPARTDDLNKDIINQCCITFCDAIAGAGYKPMYYSTITNALFKYDLSRLSEYSMWLAEYSRDTQFIYDFDMWQYSCSGVIDGIDSLVDLNLYFFDK